MQKQSSYDIYEVGFNQEKKPSISTQRMKKKLYLMPLYSDGIQNLEQNEIFSCEKNPPEDLCPQVYFFFFCHDKQTKSLIFCVRSTKFTIFFSEIFTEIRISFPCEIHKIRDFSPPRAIAIFLATYSQNFQFFPMTNWRNSQFFPR